MNETYSKKEKLLTRRNFLFGLFVLFFAMYYQNVLRAVSCTTISFLYSYLHSKIKLFQLKCRFAELVFALECECEENLYKLYIRVSSLLLIDEHAIDF